MPHNAIIMSPPRKTPNPILARRIAREWSQAELARRAGISRTAVSAIEGERLTPSVIAALSLAAVLECSGEELFGTPGALVSSGPDWAWTPRTEPCRYWEAEVSRRRLLYPVEALSVNPTAHDGTWRAGLCHETNSTQAENTLTVACCDPAAGLLAAEYARSSGFRLIVFPRGGNAALDLLQRRLVHVAGLHCSTEKKPERNAETVRAKLGSGYRLLRVTAWESGIALPADERARSVESVVRHSRCWAAREPGSAARECLDELLGRRQFAGRQVHGHLAVAEAVRAGWADAGVCVRLCADEAGLVFVPLRTETLEFCFASALQHDPRMQALIRLLRSKAYRQVVSDLPGYDCRHAGELATVPRAATSAPAANN
jgi:molybdate-binding protein/DNA-binding XRE family transcriptional regulator